MAKIALDGCAIKEVTASGHIKTQRYVRDGNYIPGAPKYSWESGYSVAARINGTAKATITNVYVNGAKLLRQNDKTTERDTYSLGSDERYESGAHSNAQGTVSNGNSRGVYAGGQLVALEGSTVKTHANVNTTLGNTRLSQNVFIGR